MLVFGACVVLGGVVVVSGVVVVLVFVVVFVVVVETTRMLQSNKNFLGDGTSPRVVATRGHTHTYTQ